MMVRNATAAAYRQGAAESGVHRVMTESEAELLKTAILVVDDEPLPRASVRRILQTAGYQVVEADCAEQALALLQANPNLQMMVTDVGLPDQLGPVLIQQATALAPGLATLLMSGDSREFLISARRVEPDTKLLHKPLARLDLLQAVEQALAAREIPANA